MDGGKKKINRKRKLKVDKNVSTQSGSKTTKRQTRSSAAAILAEEAVTYRKSWIMFQGYDNIVKRKLLSSSRTEECPEKVEIQIPPKVMELNEIPPSGKINSYSKTSHLQTITEVLYDTPIYDVLKNSNLFSVFKIPVKRGALSGKLLHNMLGRMLLTRKKYEMWFVFGNRPIKYSLREFALVTGLDCGPYSMTEKEWSDLEDKASSPDGYWWELFEPLKLTQGFMKDIATFLTEDKAKPSSKRISDVTRLRLCLILLVDGVLCCKNYSAVKASPTTVELTRDIDRFLKFPWGRLAFELTLEMVRVGTSSNPSVAKFVDRYTGTHVPIKGFTLGFQLVFLRAIPSLNNYLSKPKKDTSYADPDLKADDLKDCREMSNDKIDKLDNDPETDIYSIVNHGYQLVNSNLRWDDEVDDSSVDLLGILLAEANVFESTDWVKGNIDPIDVSIISRFSRSERVPTKKVMKKPKSAAKKEITEISVEEGDEPSEGNNVIMAEIKEIFNEWHSDARNYCEMTKKDAYKKVDAVLKKYNVGVPELSVENAKDKSMESVRPNESESDSHNSVGKEDLCNLQKREGKDMMDHGGSSRSEHANIQRCTEQELQSDVRASSYFENVPEALDMVKNLGNPDAALEESDNKASEEEEVVVRNDLVEKEADMNVKILEKQAEVEVKKDVELKKKPVIETSSMGNAACGIDVVDKCDAVIAGPDPTAKSKEKVFDVIETTTMANTENQSKLEEKADRVISELNAKAETKEKTQVIETRSRAIRASGSQPVKKGNPVDAGLDPIPDELKTAFLKKLDGYQQMFYTINGEMFPKRIFEEIYLPKTYSTNDKLMGLLLETIWERMRPTMEKYRVVMYGPHFPSLLVKEYNRLQDFTANHSKGNESIEFIWSTTLSNMTRGKSSSRPGKNRWFIDVDRIYAPMIWPDKKHWVALCIDLVTFRVTVLDSWIDRTNDAEMQKQMDPLVNILPYLIQSLANTMKLDLTKRGKFFKYGRPDISQDLEGGNCGPFSLKFIEMHSQGLSLLGITTEMVANFRIKYAIEFYERHVMPIEW